MGWTLKATNIKKSFPVADRTLSVLQDVSLEAAPGDSVAVIGPSGAGKSTLLNILGTLDAPTSGTLTLGETNPFSLRRDALARFRNQRIGFVFQDHHLLPHCCALENVLIPTIAEPPKEDPMPRAQQLLDQVGLANRAYHRPAELSGGERQRVAIARALINSPDVVLADEPTGNLDRSTAEAVSSLLLDLHKTQETILIVVTHSMRLAGRLDRRFILDDGMLAPAEDSD